MNYRIEAAITKAAFNDWLMTMTIPKNYTFS